MSVTSNWKQQIDTYNLWYLNKTGLKYHWQGKDLFQLKLLVKHLEHEKISLADFLNKVTGLWYQDKLTVPILNSQYNQIMLQAQTKQAFPDRYDRKFEDTLENDQLSKYWQHLRKIGFSKVYSTGGGSKWAKVDGYSE